MGREIIGIIDLMKRQIKVVFLMKNDTNCKVNTLLKRLKKNLSVYGYLVIGKEREDRSFWRRKNL